MEKYRRETTQDADLLGRFRELPCMACGKYPPSEAHHIRTRGAGGGDDYFNILPLCNSCHTGSRFSWHQGGSVSFLIRHKHVYDYLKQLGWSISDGKLIHTKKI